MKRILAGVDLRIDGHDWLVDRAATFARAVGGTLDLVFVVADSKKGDSEAHAAVLATQLERVPEAHRGKPLVISGSPVEQLTAQTEHYDALVMGPREPGALERLLLGTMANRVIRRASCAVYIPRTEKLSTDRPLKLLVGVDLNRGEPAWLMNNAGAWAESLGGKLDAVFAEKSPAAGIQDVAVKRAAEKQWEASRAPDRKALRALLNEATTPDTQGEAFLGTGIPQDALVAMSELYDLIVVGNREAGIVDRVLGTVTQFVVRNAECDVLTLPSANAS